MAAKNDITGDSIVSRGHLSESGQKNWDLIFPEKKEVIKDGLS